MSRVLLIHWNVAGAEERARRLRRAGYRVDILSDASEGGGALRPLCSNPPDLIVIDLGRLPSHGRAVGVFLRQQGSTRRVPIVFVDGEAEKVARVREVLPDAEYTKWPRIRSALRRALRSPPREPAVPGTMESYSGTPLPRKLGIRAGTVLALLGAPRDFERTLGALPGDVRVRRQARGPAHRVVLFVKSRAHLERRLATATRALSGGGGLWIAWPKKASGVVSDLNQKTVRAVGLDAGLVDYKICAIDDTWSGLLFTRRRAARRS